MYNPAAAISMEQANDDGTEAKILVSDDAAIDLSQSHKDVVAVSSMKQLPIVTRGGLPLTLYKNYWFVPHHAANIMKLQRDTSSFKARHGDTTIILASNPKCGTTWLKAVAFAITTRSRYNSFSVDHPLLNRNPHELVPFIEIPLPLAGAASKDPLITATTTNTDHDTIRLLATHMPFSILPERIVAGHGHGGCRIVYICREPKDAFVAGWHFTNRMRLAGGAAIDLDTAFDLFCEGFWPMGPFWDHCLEYWNQSMARPHWVLFLKYEEMMQEPAKSVRRLATFLGHPFTDEEERNGVPEEVVRLCSFETLSAVALHAIAASNNNSATTATQGFVDGHLVIEKSAFFRRGKVGDWANHMSQEMGRKLDRIVQQKLEGSGLLF